MEHVTHDSQLLKGVLGMILLSLLAEGDSYGYEMVERVHALGLPDVGEGSVYPALNRLEREGLISSYLVRSTTGPARKYYALAPKGREQLAVRLAAWNALVEITRRLPTSNVK